MKGELLRFLTVGVLNTVLGYGLIFALAYGAGWSPEFSNAAGYAFGLGFSFLLSKRFTFRSVGRPSQEFLRFLASFAFSYSVNLAVLVVLVRLVMLDQLYSQLLAGAAYVISSFLLAKMYVFTARASPAENP